MGYSWSFYGIGATIRIGREMLCLPYAFFVVVKTIHILGFGQVHQAELTRRVELDSLQVDIGEKLVTLPSLDSAAAASSLI